MERKTILQFFTFIFSHHLYRHTDASNSLMFSLASILPMSDVRCTNRPNFADDANLSVHLVLL